MKKYLSMFVVLAATALTGNAADFTAGGLSYNVISDVTKTVRVVESSSAKGDVTIPSTVTRNGAEYSVTEIEPLCFSESQMTSITIPESIIKIGDGAFRDCKKLQTITFNADDCTLAGTKENSAFYGCIAVTTVNIGDNVAVIPPYIFQGLGGLRSIAIPRNVTTIGERAFADCTNVAEIYFDAVHCGQVSNPFAGCTYPFNMVISDNVEEVPANLCVDSQLTTLTIGKNVKTIKDKAFRAKSGALQYINYNAINSTCSNPFDGGSGVKKIVLGLDVKIIPQNFASGCSSASNVIWNENLEEIGAYAFSSCKFVSFVAPRSLKTIGLGAFPSSLETVQLNEGLETLSGFAETKIKEIKIPSTVKIIGESAFKSCSKLMVVEGLESDMIESIGNNAFNNCKALQLDRLYFGKNLKHIGENAFIGDKGIHKVRLNDGLETVDNNAFNGTEAFLDTEFYLPESIRTIGGYAFQSSGITGKLVIPENLNLYGYHCFSQNAGITEIIYNATDVNGSYSSSLASPFYGLPLKTVTIGSKVKTLGYELFYGMSELEHIVIPESVVTIGGAVFQNTPKLAELTIPKSVERYGMYSFDDSGIKKLTINAKSIYYGNEANQICKTIEKLIIGEDVEVIQVCFFPDGLKWVKWDSRQDMIFKSKTSYATCPVVLGESVKSFCGYTFPTVISNAPVPPALTNPKAGAIAYVPDVNEYASDTNWAKYILRQFVTWSGTTDGQKLSYTTNFPYELTLKHYLDSEGNVMDGIPAEIGKYKAVFTFVMEDDEFELISPFEIEPNTSNTMWISDFSTRKGRRVVIPVEMVNEEAITSFQFDLYLPEGVSLAVDEYGDYMVDLTNRKSNTHSIATSDIDGGKGVRIAAVSMRNQTFSGNNGTLVELTVDVASDAPVGESLISLRNIRMVEPSSAAQEFFTNRNDAKIVIGNVKEGDTNDDGKVTMADVVNTVNMTLGIVPDVFVFEAADLVADGKITISDVVAVMNMALNVSNAPAKASAKVEEGDENPMEDVTSDYDLTAEDVSLELGENCFMSVSMENPENVTAFQFDLTLPEGITVPEDEWGDPSITLSKRASRTHMLVTRYQENGDLRVASYSSKNDPFRANTGELLSVELLAAEDIPYGEYEIGFSNIELTNPDATPHYIPDFKVFATVGRTGIECLRYVTNSFSVRGGNGEIIVFATEDTDVTILNFSGVIVNRQNINKGTTRISAAPGFYIVNGNKIIVR